MAKELTVSAAVKKIRALDAAEEELVNHAIEEAASKAERAARDSIARRRSNILMQVHESGRDAVLKETRIKPSLVVDDVPPMTAAEIDEALDEIPANLRSPVPPPKPGERVEVVRK